MDYVKWVSIRDVFPFVFLGVGIGYLLALIISAIVLGVTHSIYFIQFAVFLILSSVMYFRGDVRVL